MKHAKRKYLILECDIKMEQHNGLHEETCLHKFTESMVLMVLAGNKYNISRWSMTVKQTRLDV